MDARSMFHDLTLGVESSITGMVTLMAVAEALSRVRALVESTGKELDNRLEPHLKCGLNYFFFASSSFVL